MSTSSSKKIQIVLVQPQHPGNIGATARAMKTMGLSQLRIIERQPNLHLLPMSRAMAAGADDVLEEVQCYQQVADAVTDCDLVIGTSARPRFIGPTVINTQQLQQQLPDWLRQYQRMAVLFGPENHGLCNDDLALCHYHLWINSNPDYSALNLAQAVQIIAYCIRQVLLGSSEQPAQPITKAYAEHGEPIQVAARLHQLATKVGFIKPQQPVSTTRRLSHWLLRSKPNRREVAMLHGLISDIERHLL